MARLRLGADDYVVKPDAAPTTRGSPTATIPSARGAAQDRAAQRVPSNLDAVPLVTGWSGGVVATAPRSSGGL